MIKKKPYRAQSCTISQWYWQLQKREGESMSSERESPICFQTKPDSIWIPVGWKKEGLVWKSIGLSFSHNNWTPIGWWKGGLVCKYIWLSLSLDIDSPSLYQYWSDKIKLLFAPPASLSKNNPQHKNKVKWRRKNIKLSNYIEFI